MLVYRGLQHVPLPPLLQREPFVLPSGKEAIVTCTSQLMLQETTPDSWWLIPTHADFLLTALHAGSAGDSGPSHGCSGTRLRGQLQPHRPWQRERADRVPALNVPAFRCHLSLPFTFLWLKHHWLHLISKGVGKSNFSCARSFGQWPQWLLCILAVPVPQSHPEFPQHPSSACSLSPAWNVLPLPTLGSACPGFCPQFSPF